MKETIYLSGPISEMANDNLDEFNQAESYYKKRGYNVINPHILSLTLHLSHLSLKKKPPTQKEIMGYIIQIILTEVDKVALLPNYNKSVSVFTELFACMQYRITIIEVYTNKPLVVSGMVKVDYGDYTIHKFM